MVNKILAIFVSILLLAAVSLVVWKWMQTPTEEDDISPSVLRLPWIEVSIGENPLLFMVPVVMEDLPITIPKEASAGLARATAKEGEGRGVFVYALYMSAKPFYQPDLAKISQAEIASMKRAAGTTLVLPSQKEYYLKGKKILEIEAQVNRQKGKPLKFRGILIRDVTYLWKISLLYKDGQPDGDRIWEKLKDSLRFPGDA
jgi:hypothetical protein